MEQDLSSLETKIRTAVLSKMGAGCSLFVYLKALDKDKSGRVELSLDAIRDFFNKQSISTIHRWICKGEHQNWWACLRDNRGNYTFYLRSWSKLKQQYNLHRCISNWINLQDLKDHPIKYITTSVVVEQLQAYKRKRVIKELRNSNDKTRVPEVEDLFNLINPSVSEKASTYSITTGAIPLLLVRDYFPQYQVAQTFVADNLGTSKSTVQRTLKYKKKVQICVKDRDMNPYLLDEMDDSSRYFKFAECYYRRSACVYEYEFKRERIVKKPTPLSEYPNYQPKRCNCCTLEETGQPLTLNGKTVAELNAEYRLREDLKQKALLNELSSNRRKQFEEWKSWTGSRLDYNWFDTCVAQDGVKMNPYPDYSKLTPENLEMMTSPITSSKSIL